MGPHLVINRCRNSKEMYLKNLQFGEFCSRVEGNLLLEKVQNCNSNFDNGDCNGAIFYSSVSKLNKILVNVMGTVYYRSLLKSCIRLLLIPIENAKNWFSALIRDSKKILQVPSVHLHSSSKSAIKPISQGP